MKSYEIGGHCTGMSVLRVLQLISSIQCDTGNSLVNGTSNVASQLSFFPHKVSDHLM